MGNLCNNQCPQLYVVFCLHPPCVLTLSDPTVVFLLLITNRHKLMALLMGEVLAASSAVSNACIAQQPCIHCSHLDQFLERRCCLLQIKSLHRLFKDQTQHSKSSCAHIFRIGIMTSGLCSDRRWLPGTAHLYEEQISIGATAVTQACCESVLQSTTQNQLLAAAANGNLAIESAIASMYVMDMLCCNFSPYQFAELNRQQSCQLTAVLSANIYNLAGMTSACSALL